MPQRHVRGDKMTRSKATAIGFTAILMWSLLALMTIASAPVPPFLLNALTFAIGGLIGLVWTARRGFALLGSVDPTAYLFGTLGLFGITRCISRLFALPPPRKPG